MFDLHGLLTWVGAKHDRLGPFGFRLQRRPIRNVGIPFDQRRHGACPAQRVCVERPHDVIDRAIVRIDQQLAVMLIGFACMARQMDLARTRASGKAAI